MNNRLTRIRASLKALLIAIVTLNGCQSATTLITSSEQSSKYTWPDTEPVDKSDPYWEINNNLNCNGIEYKKEEVEPGKWQWVVNIEFMDRMEAIDKRRRELFLALTTRALTKEEMQEVVTQYGTTLNIRPCVSYRPQEKNNELLKALLIQMRFQAFYNGDVSNHEQN